MIRFRRGVRNNVDYTPMNRFESVYVTNNRELWANRAWREAIGSIAPRVS